MLRACERAVCNRARRVQPRDARGRAGEDGDDGGDDDGSEDGANERGKSRTSLSQARRGDDGCAAVTGSEGRGRNADGSSKEGRYVTVRVRVRGRRMLMVSLQRSVTSLCKGRGWEPQISRGISCI